jgi:hypothetical protein
MIRAGDSPPVAEAVRLAPTQIPGAETSLAKIGPTFA